MAASPAAGRSHPNAARSRARRLAMQALYQWQFTAMDAGEILAQFEQDEAELRNADRAYFRELVERVVATATELDECYAPALNRSLDEVNPVERAILRLATYELMHRIDIPYKVVINEAVALTRKFGAEQGHGFVNGVLDQVARRLRAVEHPQGAPGGGLPGAGGS